MHPTDDQDPRLDLLRRLVIEDRGVRVVATGVVVLLALAARVFIDPALLVRMPLFGLVLAGAFGWIWGPVGGAVGGLAILPLGELAARLLGSPGPVAPPVGQISAVITVAVIGGVFGLARWAVGRALAAGDAERAARREIRQLLDDLPIGVFRIGWDGTVAEVNRSFAEMVGAERSEVLGRNVIEFSAEDDMPARVRQAVVDDEIAGLVLPMRHRDGSVVHGRFHGRVVRDRRGAPTRIDGAVRNVTDLLAAEEEARQANQTFRTVFDNAPIGIALADEEGRIISANPAFAELVGVDGDALTGRRWIELTHPDDRQHNLGLFDQLRRGEVDGYELEKRYLRPDGSEVWVLVRSTVVKDPDGRFLFQVGQVVDITDRKREAEALERLVRSKDEFIASVSHELRTPLTVVLGLAEELQTGVFDQAESVELVRMICEQSREVADIVEDLLVAARADIGKVTVRPERVDLEREAESVMRTLPRAADLDWSGVQRLDVWADPVRLRQVLRNLLTNALRYGGPTVRIRSFAANGQAVVEVADDGPGIPTELAEGIFQPYVRAHVEAGTTSSVGLGLTVSRTLARLMDGELEYRREDGWTVFRLTLPVEAAQRGRYHAPPVAASG